MGGLLHADYLGRARGRSIAAGVTLLGCQGGRTSEGRHRPSSIAGRLQRHAQQVGGFRITRRDLGSPTRLRRGALRVAGAIQRPAVAKMCVGVLGHPAGLLSRPLRQ